MKIKVIFAVAVVLILAVVFLSSREEEGVPLAVVSGFRITGSVVQVVFTNRSPVLVTVWPVDFEIKAGQAWTNYNDGLEPVMDYLQPHSPFVVTKKLPVGNYAGRLQLFMPPPCRLGKAPSMSGGNASVCAPSSHTGRSP